MSDPFVPIALAAFALAALGVALIALLKGWQGWLDLRRAELGGAARPSPAMERIELADLKERIRKLEAIAACVDP